MWRKGRMNLKCGTNSKWKLFGTYSKGSEGGAWKSGRACQVCTKK